MKKAVPFVLFFFCFSLFVPPRVRSAIPLAVLVPATIGAAVLAVGGTTYALKNPGSGWSFDGHSMTQDIWAYSKVLAAGGEYLLGKTTTAVLDAYKTASENLSDSYSTLRGLIGDFINETSSPFPSIGDTFDSALFGCSGIVKVSNITTVLSYMGATYDHTACYPSTIISWRVLDITPQGNYLVETTTIYKESTTDDPTWEPSPPVVTPGTAPDLGQYLDDHMTPDLSQELDNLLKERPDLFILSPTEAIPANPDGIEDYPPAQPISGTEKNQWAQSQGAQAQQAYIDTLQDLVDANPTNAELAADLAKAQAEQVQQEAEDIKDSFDPISASPFDQPYDPGAFNIPARFSSFMGNVQGSGLFSFSSAFFNSLPGGGSPVYTIEAGQYGTHTVDLSQTLGTGLAVLKTVLLLLFGFLSIRVVILKR